MNKTVGGHQSTLTVDYHLGFAIPMLVGTTFGLVMVIISLLVSLETKGRDYTSDLMVA